ncbi:MAG TPA: 1-phosphofructokinase family hexose kinase [Egibacteraceae bacterium]
MILTVTLNAALDITYHVASVKWNDTNRVRRVRQRAGGKGVNVARILTRLGRPAAVTGLLGGDTGATIRRDLAAAGLDDRFLTIDGESRRSVAIVSDVDGDATIFNEPGPRVRADDWARFAQHYAGLLGDAAAVVASGSLPPGLPDDAYARLTRSARARGLPVAVDSEGPALAAAAAAGPAVVKPNAAELQRTTGLADPLAGAAALRDAGAEAVVVSLGADGLLAVTGEGTWRARLPQPLAGNPIGAGDAAVAALIVGAVDETPWPLRLESAVALSAAAVAAPVAGEVDVERYRELLDVVEVTAG